MTMSRWDPFSDLVSLRKAMDRLFEEGYGRPRALATALSEDMIPSMDMYQTNQAIVVKVSLPGFKPEDVHVTIQGETLSIEGECKEEEVRREDYYLRERRYASFHRTVTLPPGLEGSKAEASYEHGVLTLTIPKSEEVKPKTIRVNVPKSAIEGKKG